MNKPAGLFVEKDEPEPLRVELEEWVFNNYQIEGLMFLLQGLKESINCDQRPIFGSDLL